MYSTTYQKDLMKKKIKTFFRLQTLVANFPKIMKNIKSQAKLKPKCELFFSVKAKAKQDSEKNKRCVLPI